MIQSAVRQMENNIRVNNDQMVSHSLPDTPFSLISPLALSNHLILGLPLFRTFSSSFFLRSALLFSPCSYQFRILSLTAIAISPTFGSSIPYLSFVILSTFVTSHIHRSNFFYCAFCNVPAPILPLSCAASSRVFTFIFCPQHYTDSLPVLLTVLHAEGDFLYPVLHLPLTSVPDAYLNAFTLFTVSSCKWMCPRKIYLPPTDLAT